eukprot:gene570-2410_t
MRALLASHSWCALRRGRRDTLTRAQRLTVLFAALCSIYAAVSVVYRGRAGTAALVGA